MADTTQGQKWLRNSPRVSAILAFMVVISIGLTVAGDESGDMHSLDNFEAGDLKNWVAGEGVTLGLEKTNVFKGKCAMSATWLDEDKGWWFSIRKVLKHPEDLRGYGKLRVRFAKNSGAQGLIYLNYRNGDSWVAGTGSIGSFWAKWNQQYTAYEIELGDYPRDAVTEIKLFWSDEFGKKATTGEQRFYLDDIEVLPIK